MSLAESMSARDSERRLALYSDFFKAASLGVAQMAYNDKVTAYTMAATKHVEDDNA